MEVEALPARPISVALVGGDLALDFANTVSGRGGQAQIDHLRSSTDVVAWARHAGVPGLSDLTGEAPNLLGNATALRAAIAGIAAAVCAGRNAPPASGRSLLAAHAVALSGAAAHLVQGRLVITYDAAAATYETAILGPIAAAAIALFSETDPSRLKRCPAKDCGWFFRDTTKNNSRCWCDMQVCGARSKVAAFRSRQRNMRCDGV